MHSIIKHYCYCLVDRNWNESIMQQVVCLKKKKKKNNFYIHIEITFHENILSAKVSEGKD